MADASTIASPRHPAAGEDEGLWVCATVRHWNIDRANPR
jgi:hypothetical protein